VQQVNVSEPAKLDEDVTLSYRMSIPRYAEALPKSLRFYPFGSGRSYTETYASLSERRFDLLISNPWVNRHEFRYALPVGFEIPELPSDLNEETPFGRLRMSHRIENGKLICRAEVALTQTRIKASDYAAFRAFMGRLDRAFSRRLIASASRGQTAQK
jgi:hypothetical protein